MRITHIPTGTVAACQNERSQLQNKAVAMRILKARLAELERQKREDEMDSIRGERKAVDFGSQIRSYVLAPYQMVKDHRTDEEMGDPQRVLDGDIDRFIEAELRTRAEGPSDGPTRSEWATRSRLVLASFVMLFAELALIRWVSAFQIYVAYFTNFILLASFLGIGVGFLRAARSPSSASGGRPRRSRPSPAWCSSCVSCKGWPGAEPRDDLRSAGTPDLGRAAACCSWVHVRDGGVAQGSPQLFERFEPLEAYRLDITGSLLGIVVFSALSFLGAGPLVWGLVLGVCFVVLVPRRPVRGWWLASPPPWWCSRWVPSPSIDVWSPYYRVTVYPRRDDGQIPSGELAAAPVDAAAGGHPGGLLLQAVHPPAVARRATCWWWGQATATTWRSRSPRARTTSMRSRSTSACRRRAASCIPRAPYQDPRVTPAHRRRPRVPRTDRRRYDLILFALPDSLTLVSGQGSLRLESYLFTREAMETVRERAGPGGAFAMYNYYRPDVFERYANTMREVFGHEPVLRRGDRQRRHPIAVGPDDRTGSRRTSTASRRPWQPGRRVPNPATDDRPFPYVVGRVDPLLLPVVAGRHPGGVARRGACRLGGAAGPHAALRRPVLHGGGVPAAGDQERGAVRAAVRHDVVRQLAGVRGHPAGGARGGRAGARARLPSTDRDVRRCSWRAWRVAWFDPARPAPGAAIVPRFFASVPWRSRRCSWRT